MRISLLISTITLLSVSLQASSPVTPFSAESEAFRKQKLTKTMLEEATLNPVEKLPAYTKYDFSPLWLEDNDPYGFIGSHYQRLQIKLLTIKKSAADPTLYALTGKTRVLGVVRTFSGTVRLEQVREARNRQLPPPEEGFKDKVTASGVATGSYELAEDPKLPKTGVFRGVLATYWYTDAKYRLHYDGIEGYADGFTNNQYVGTWTSYTTHQPLRCNWGYRRIPNSGDFDIGAGEFSPADKYLAFGWQDVRDCTFGWNSEALTAAACQREKQVWWK